MKKLYNLLLVAFYTCGAVWILALAGLQLQKDADHSAEAVVMYVLQMLLPVIHYGMIYWGRNRGWVWTISVIVLCLVDMVCFGVWWIPMTLFGVMFETWGITLWYLLITVGIGLRVYSTGLHFKNRKKRTA